MSKDDEDKISNEEKDSYENRKNQEQNFTGTKQNIRRRRELVFSLDTQGYSISEIVDKIPVSESTIEKDLKNQHQICSVLLQKYQNFGMIKTTVDTLNNLELIRDELWQKYRKGRVEDRFRNLSKIIDISIQMQKMYGVNPTRLSNETLDQMEAEAIEYEVDLDFESRN